MAAENQAPGKRLAHSVFFTLRDTSPERIQELMTACQQFLADHPGTDYFAVGSLVEDLDRSVNDLDYHVSLHVHFQDRASHDQYQQDSRHLQFIEENKANWTEVRVFDSYLD